MFFAFVILYIFAFSFSVISGAIFWFKRKGPKLLAIYELLAGIYTVFILFIYIEPFYKKFLGIANVLPIVAIVPLIIVGLFVSLPIGNTAHLGGLIAGLGYGFYLRKKYPRKTRMISQQFSR